jgi:hypothetical protein
MDVVVEGFKTIRQQLSTWKLRSRVIDKEESSFENIYRGAAH